MKDQLRMDSFVGSTRSSAVRRESPQQSAAPPRQAHSATLRSRSGPGSKKLLVPSPPCIPNGLPSRISSAVASVAYTQLVNSHLISGGTMASLMNQCAVAYQHMLQTTRDLPFPNSLRTSFCCVMIERLFTSAALHDSSNFVDLLKADLFASLFHNTTPDLYLPSKATELDVSLSRFKVHSHYFTELEVTTTERDLLLAEMQNKRSVNTKEMALMERIIFRWQAMMVDRLFGAWRNYVSRRRRWVHHMDHNFALKTRHRTVSRSFAAWRDATQFSRIHQQLQVSLARNKEQEVSEEGLLREYAKLVAGIEAMKSEKQMLQESTRRAHEEIAALRISMEQLQGRLDQQRSTTNAWKEVAVQLCHFVSQNTPSTLEEESPLENNHVSSLLRAVSSSLVSPVGSLRHPIASHRETTSLTDHPLGESPFPLSQSPGAMLGFAGAGSSIDISSSSSPARDAEGWDDTLLVWLNGTIRGLDVQDVSTAHRDSSRPLSPQEIARRKQVTNFSGDFADGSVLLDLAHALKAVPEAEIAQHRAEKQRHQSGDPNVKLIRTLLDTLIQFCRLDSDVHVDPLDVATGNAPAALRLLVAQLMASSVALRCPLCEPSEGGLADILQRTMKKPQQGLSTIADIQQRVAVAMHHHQTRRSELRAVVQNSWSTMSSSTPAPLPDDTIMKHIVHEAISKQQIPRERCDEIIEKCRYVARQELLELRQVYLLFEAAAGETISSHTWLRLIGFAKSALRFPLKRLTTTLISELPSSKQHVGIDFPTCNALIIYIAVSNAWTLTKQSVNDTLSVLGPELVRITSTIVSTQEILARHEINAYFSQSHVGSVFSDSTATLAKLWAGTTHSTSGLTCERFVQLLKEGKCLDNKQCTIENIKRLFHLFVDGEGSLMTFSEFGRCLLAVASWKDSSPLTHGGLKFKRLIDDIIARKH